MQLKNRQKRGSGQDGMLASFHDHIKIANEIQNNQPREPSKDQMNRSSITKDIKKTP